MSYRGMAASSGTIHPFSRFLPLAFVAAPEVQIQRLLLPLDGGIEVTGLGIRGSQGLEGINVLQLGQLAGSSRRFDRFLAIANFLVGASGQYPMRAAYAKESSGSRRIISPRSASVPSYSFFNPERWCTEIRLDGLGVASDRFGVVGDGLVVLPLGSPGIATQDMPRWTWGRAGSPR